MTWYKNLVDTSRLGISADRQAGDVIIGHESYQDFPSGATAKVKSEIGIVMRGSEILGYTTHNLGFADSYCFTNYGGRKEVLIRLLGREPTREELRESYRAGGVGRLASHHRNFNDPF